MVNVKWDVCTTFHTVAIETEIFINFFFVINLNSLRWHLKQVYVKAMFKTRLQVKNVFLIFEYNLLYISPFFNNDQVLIKKIG